MNRSEIAKDLRQFTGSGMITRKQLAEYLGVKSTWRVSETYLKGLTHDKHRYFITEVAARIWERLEV